jgi:hypothetical protein
MWCSHRPMARPTMAVSAIARVLWAATRSLIQRKIHRLIFRLAWPKRKTVLGPGQSEGAGLRVPGPTTRCIGYAFCW